ncbi:MAG: LPS assembly protein LptD [Gammaproteobacteria bacterium]|nr:LPS assembly protein LptD [Gammaproteobacteria bacterium]
MPPNSRKLRLLILATLASSGASTSFMVQAGPTAWSCQTDPLTGGWSCNQSGDKSQAVKAVRMAQQAAGVPELSDAQIEIATSPPNNVTPASTQPLAASMAEARLASEQKVDTPSASSEAEIDAVPETAPQIIAAPEPVASKPAPLAAIERQVIDLPAAPQARATTSPAQKPPQAPAPEPEAAPAQVAAVRPSGSPVTETQDGPLLTPLPSGDDANTKSTQAPAEAPVAAPPGEPQPAEATVVATEEPANDPYRLARSAGQLSDAEIADLQAARRMIDLGEADEAHSVSPALQRLKQLSLQTPADAETEIPATISDHAPSGWPADLFDASLPPIPDHIAVGDIDTYPEIDNRRAWALCGVNSDPSMTRDIPVQAVPNRESLPTYATADDVQGKRQKYYTLFGDAELRRGDQLLQGDIIHYDATTERADAEGNVRYREANLAMDSDWGYLVMADDTGEFGRSRFHMPERHGRGTAEHVNIDSRTLMQGDTTTYTTCNYGVDSWYLDSAELELDRAAGVGTATSAWVRIHGVPVAYTPWISFPIDDRRKSGLLPPSYGSSDVNGTEISLPFYWNIAPHRDATITPTLYENRGVRAETRFRYLNPESSGLVVADVLPDDNIYGKDRGFFHLDHQASLAPNLLLDVYGSHLSDRFFLKDFAETYLESDTTSIQRYAKLTWSPSNWLITGRMHEDVLVDNTTPSASRPYRLLPDITASTVRFDPETGLDLSFDSRMTYFQNAARLESGRINLNPVLRMPFQRSYGYITPEIALNHTQWHLNSSNAGSADVHQYLTVPTFAVDSGIYIDKEFEFAGNDLIHTIEPRVRYTYTPNTDQSSRPLFDSGLQGITYSSLFTNNRFSGGDRVGDANQLAVGVTSRLQQANGTDLAILSFGELFYFDDREVTIGAQTDADRASNSDFVAELTASLPNGIEITNTLRWDHKQNKTPTNNWYLSYSLGPEQYIRYSYSHTSNSIREHTISSAWPITARWHGIASWERDDLRSKDVQTTLGLEYETCCWAARFVAETRYDQYSTSIGTATSEDNTSFMFQLELKGLTGLGNDVKKLFGSSAYY